MFRKLGYTENLSEIRSDEELWFPAIEIALAKARKAERQRRERKNGK